MTPSFRTLATRITSLAGILFLAGCAQRHTDIARRDSPNRDAPVAQTRPTLRDIPLFYQQRIVPPPLTPVQLQRIREQPDLVLAPGCELWFVQVRTNWIKASTWEWWGMAFFTPNIATDRFRRGKYAYVGDSSEGSPFPLLAATLDDAHKTNRPPMQEYIQVSERGRPFGDQLAVPEAMLLPFPVPENLTNAEIVEIVDFARTATPPNGNLFWRPTDRNEPILGIKKNADAIEVEFGWQEGSLSGGGHLLTIKRVGDHYEAVGISIWAS